MLPKIPPNVSNPNINPVSDERRMMTPEQVELVVHSTVDRIMGQLNNLKNLTISLLNSKVNETKPNIDKPNTSNDETHLQKKETK